MRSQIRNSGELSFKKPTLATHPLAIACPEEEETIASTELILVKIRATVPMVKVEIMIDGDGWMPCRESMGYWWFDWNEYFPKWYTVHARGYTQDGAMFMTAARRFAVKPVSVDLF